MKLVFSFQMNFFALFRKVIFILSIIFQFTTDQNVELFVRNNYMEKIENKTYRKKLKKRLLSKEQLKELITSTIQEQNQTHNHHDIHRSNAKNMIQQKFKDFLSTTTKDNTQSRSNHDKVMTKAFGFAIVQEFVNRKKLVKCSSRQQMRQKYGIFRKLDNFINIEEVEKKLKIKIERQIKNTKKFMNSQSKQLEQNDELIPKRTKRKINTKAKMQVSVKYEDKHNEMIIKNFLDLYKLIGLKLFNEDEFQDLRKLIKNIEQWIYDKQEITRDLTLNKESEQQVVKIFEYIFKNVLQRFSNKPKMTTGNQIQIKQEEKLEDDIIFKIESAQDLKNLLNTSADLIVSNNLNIKEYRKRIRYIRESNRQLIQKQFPGYIFQLLEPSDTKPEPLQNQNLDKKNDINSIIKKLHQNQQNTSHVDNQIQDFIQDLQYEQINCEANSIFREALLLLILYVSNYRKQHCKNMYKNRKDEPKYKQNKDQNEQNLQSTANLQCQPRQSQRYFSLQNKFKKINLKNKPKSMHSSQIQNCLMQHKQFSQESQKFDRIGQKYFPTCVNTPKKSSFHQSNIKENQNNSFNKKLDNCGNTKAGNLVSKIDKNYKNYCLQKNITTTKLKKINLSNLNSTKKFKQPEFDETLLDQKENNNNNTSNNNIENKLFPSSSFSYGKRSNNMKAQNKKFQKQKYYKKLHDVLNATEDFAQQNKIAWKKYKKREEKQRTNMNERTLDIDGQIKNVIKDIENTIIKKRWSSIHRIRL